MRRIQYYIILITESPLTKWLITFSQTTAATSAILYKLYEPAVIIKYFKFTFFIFQGIVILFMLIESITVSKMGVIKFILNRATGFLYDARTKFRNVSLRAKTINVILQKLFSLPNGLENLYSAGFEVGGDFFEEFKSYQKIIGSQLAHDKIIKKWLEYDSSSGMGRFELTDYQLLPLRIRIKVVNPFTIPGKCKFLEGYIGGFCQKLFNKNILVEELQCNVDDTCEFEVRVRNS